MTSTRSRIANAERTPERVEVNALHLRSPERAATTVNTTELHEKTEARLFVILSEEVLSIFKR